MENNANNSEKLVLKMYREEMGGNSLYHLKWEGEVRDLMTCRGLVEYSYLCRGWKQFI